MITGTEMYWLTRMSHLHDGVLIVGIILAIATGIAAIVCLYAAAEQEDWGYKGFFGSMICFILSVFMAVSSAFIPTTQEMCAIKAIPMIVNNEQVQELPNKVVELANDWIDELKPNKDNENGKKEKSTSKKE
jgi:hypothetical protein